MENNNNKNPVTTWLVQTQPKQISIVNASQGKISMTKLEEWIEKMLNVKVVT